MLPAFGWHAVLTNWEFAPVVTAATGLAGAAYLWGAWRVGRRHPARPWPWWRSALFLGGLAVVVLATETGIGAYDDRDDYGEDRFARGEPPGACPAQHHGFGSDLRSRRRPWFGPAVGTPGCPPATGTSGLATLLDQSS